MAETLVSIPIKCPKCAYVSFVDVTKSELKAWRIDGELIQNAMPRLSVDEREILISGLCLDCQ